MDALLRQRFGDRLTNARTGSRYQRYLPAQVLCPAHEILLVGA
jgi:hypothetical protein